MSAVLSTLRQLRITRTRLLLLLVATPVAMLLLSGCASPASTHDSGAAGDSAGTTTGGCADILGVLNDPNNNGNRGLQPAGTDANGKATPDDCTALAKTNPAVLAVAEQAGQNRIAINLIWTLVTGYLVMFMQAGFALVETGVTRAKSASHTMMMNFMVYALGMLGYLIAGIS